MMLGEIVLIFLFPMGSKIVAVDAWRNSAGISVSDARLNNTVTSVSDGR